MLNMAETKTVTGVLDTFTDDELRVVGDGNFAQAERYIEWKKWLLAQAGRGLSQEHLLPLCYTSLLFSRAAGLHNYIGNAAGSTLTLRQFEDHAERMRQGLVGDPEASHINYY